METVIKLKPAELNSDLLNLLKKIIGKDNDINITINLTPATNSNKLRTETEKEYFLKLDESIKQVNEVKVVSFTGKEFKQFAEELILKQ